MRVLIAEDDPVSRRLLQDNLVKWGYDVLAACDGLEAWQILQYTCAPNLAILDWMMPRMDGIEVCTKVREAFGSQPVYIILLTARVGKQDLVDGLETGADDFLTKPFDPQELRARVQAGARVVQLQSNLADRVKELEDALFQVNQLQGLLPICSYCKSIRDDQNYWQKVENYIAQHSEAQFTHSICPDCLEKAVVPQLNRTS